MKKNIWKNFGLKKKHHGKFEMNCRSCKSHLNNIFIDLGMTPLANSFLTHNEINQQETFFPLRVFVCSKCFLVQLEEFENPDKIFSNYMYFSSFSETMLLHVKEFSKNIIKKLELKKDHQIIEIASNDGYLLQYFKNEGIPILGIEPAKNIAEIAEKKGIHTINKFLTIETAKELKKSGIKADLLIAFNVLPHVPNLNDFIQAMKELLKENGVIVIQFSDYLPSFMKQIEFDTIYHEHFSYFSLIAVQKILEENGLVIFDLEEFDIHGGSLRIFLKHKENQNIPISLKVQEQINKEIQLGLKNIHSYSNFSEDVKKLKKNILKFFINTDNENKKIVCYGAPAKGNTLLNYCGIGRDFIEYTVDKNPHKQKLFLPGTHIPILKPEKILETKPDYVIILPWNFKDEIMKEMKGILEWGGKFVTFIPEVKIYS